LISFFRQTKGLAVGLYAVTKALMAVATFSVLFKFATRNALRDMMPNHIFTWLSQLDEVVVLEKNIFGQE
jgi:hypothetical protein